MNEMPFVIPNFMPYNPNQNNNDDLKKDIQRILREIEQIERRLSNIENNLNIKTNNYLSSNANDGKGHYMI